MDFDGVVSKEGYGAGVWVRTPKHDTKFFSFKPYFECTNNIVEYEALILGFIVLKDMKARRMYVYGDPKLIIN